LSTADEWIKEFHKTGTEDEEARKKLEAEYRRVFGIH